VALAVAQRAGDRPDRVVDLCRILLEEAGRSDALDVASRVGGRERGGHCYCWIQLINPRSFAPTCSISCFSPSARYLVNCGRPASSSAIHSFANVPSWISPRMRFISCFVASVTTRGPRV